MFTVISDINVGLYIVQVSIQVKHIALGFKKIFFNLYYLILIRFEPVSANKIYWPTAKTILESNWSTNKVNKIWPNAVSVKLYRKK